jgi:hypothetical protein
VGRRAERELVVFGPHTSERYRGWRTALLALIVNEVLTDVEVNRAFGPVSENEASELYRETLQQYRQRKERSLGET